MAPVAVGDGDPEGAPGRRRRGTSAGRAGGQADTASAAATSPPRCRPCHVPHSAAPASLQAILAGSAPRQAREGRIIASCRSVPGLRPSARRRSARMRCLAVCQTELVGRLLHAVLAPRHGIRDGGREPRPGPPLHDAGAPSSPPIPAGSTPTSAPTCPPRTCVVDRGRPPARPASASSRRSATPAACWSTCSAPAPRTTQRTEKLRTEFPEVTGSPWPSCSSRGSAPSSTGRSPGSGSSSTSATSATPTAC